MGVDAGVGLTRTVEVKNQSPRARNLTFNRRAGLGSNKGGIRY